MTCWQRKVCSGGKLRASPAMTVWLDEAPLPRGFDGPDELEEFMARPSRALATDLAAIDGDVLIGEADPFDNDCLPLGEVGQLLPVF